MKDFQPLIAAALAFIAGLAAWLKLREDRKVAEFADREKKKALYWLAHTAAGICSGYSAAALKAEIDDWIKAHPAEDAAIDPPTQSKWQQEADRLASKEYDAAYEQLSVFPLSAFNSIRMLNNYNRNLRILASDATLSSHSARFLSFMLADVIKYSSELKMALDPYVANFTWQEKKL